MDVLLFKHIVKLSSLFGQNWTGLDTIRQNCLTKCLTGNKKCLTKLVSFVTVENRMS